MRILITVDPEIPVPPLTYGGIERIVDLLVRGLTDRGHQVALIAHPESTCPAARRFGWPRREAGGAANVIANSVALARAVVAFRPDVIHSFSRLAYLLPLLASGVRKVMSYQRIPTLRTGQLAVRIARRGTLQFTGCSEFTCGLGKRAGGRWTAIPNFVDTDRMPFSPSVAPDAPLLFLSRVESIKGAHRAIAVARATGRPLIIAGNRAERGPERLYFDREVAPYIDDRHVRYVGPVDDVRKAQLLGSAAAMIVPIQWDEPFGIVFAEALACGTPVISCPRGALPEIVRQGIDGFLTEDFDEMCKAVARLPEIDRMACRERAVSAFSAAAVIPRYEQCYRDGAAA